MIELTITALAHSGEGVGRHEGRAVFVPFALPGERVHVEIVEVKKNYARARLVKIVTPSPNRIEPRCPHHFTLPSPVVGLPSVTACGGCQLQHLAYPAQLRFKQHTVIEQLTRLGGFTAPPVRATLPSPAPFGYRNHMQFALAPEGALGLLAAQSNTVIPIRECPIAASALMQLFPHLAFEAMPEVDYVTLRAGADDELIVFETAGDAPEVEVDFPVSAALLRPDGASFALANRDYLVETVRDRAFRISAGAFFQVNTPVAEMLVEQVLAALDLRGEETVLDLYCGVGLFSAFIAPRAARLIGIESFEPAVEDAVANLDDFDHIEIYNAPVEAALPALNVPADAAVLDPPRAGCAPEVIDALLALRAPRLVYVSCDPATFARDAKRLGAGGYTLDWVQPLDMFPQTYHVECVGRFSLSHSPG
jgi:23S rRNA (uracil1939-C5)-methyltransferase